jgi:hypothetical protein
MKIWQSLILSDAEIKQQNQSILPDCATSHEQVCLFRHYFYQTAVLMNQLFTHFALFSGLSFLFISCQPGATCHELTGRWSNREGQTLSFQPNGKALWLIKFGSQYDTFPITYTYNCKEKIPTLDLSGFQNGPLAGKTLYGIIEWSSDSVFRIDAEPGTSPETRPSTFNSEHSERYFRDTD